MHRIKDQISIVRQSDMLYQDLRHNLQDYDMRPKSIDYIAITSDARKYILQCEVIFLEIALVPSLAKVYFYDKSMKIAANIIQD